MDPLTVNLMQLNTASSTLQNTNTIKMSKASGSGSLAHRLGHGVKSVFWQATDEEINGTMNDDTDNNSFSEEINDDDPQAIPDGSDDPNKIEAGRRSPRWYERTENIVKENRDRSIQNKRLLERVDYRTVWIARLIIGLLITILGGILAQILF